ncbi:hypothetical protein ACJMK2_008516, partial [Sinanodonta woodiana]
ASLKSNRFLVAAIDFGTTFSSWACSFKDDYEKEPTKIIVKQWNIWYYFSRFKMALFKDRNLSRRTQIEDEFGKKMLAMKVISLVIRYLKDDLQKELTSKITCVFSFEEEIQWVLTVPAIWNDKARSFMREAAIELLFHRPGIRNDRLLIALEPEAASVYCRQIPLETNSSDGKLSIVPLCPGT